jgi:peptidoglycan/xylan/chitin deacetylase (PgdA/CDA1 family)
MDLRTGVSRREALGLGALGVLGACVTGSALLRGDAPPRVAARAPARAAARPITAHNAHAAHGVARPPLIERLVPVAVRRAPAFKVHDIHPDAPTHAIALTIDDGPSREWTPKVLALLDRYGVHATFCLIGAEVRAHPELVREIVAAGHDIANHTMHHPMALAGMSARGIEAEIGDAHRCIQEVGSRTPRLFRSPGGSWSKAVLASVARHGMLPIDWDVDPRDWSRPGADHITRTLLRGRAGDILLCHDGGGDRSQTLRSLTKVIPALQDRGLEFIAL